MQQKEIEVAAQRELEQQKRAAEDRRIAAEERWRAAEIAIRQQELANEEKRQMREMQMQQDQRYRADVENIIAAKERTARLEVELWYREQQLQAEREAPPVAAQNVTYSMLSTPTIPHIEQQVTSSVHTTTHTSQPLMVTEPIDLTGTTPTTDSSRDDTSHSYTLASYKHAQLMR